MLSLWKRRILVLWKTGTGEFSFNGKPEWENFFFFIRELWKTRIGEFSFCGKRESPFFCFFFFIREFPFCAKRELGNSRFPGSENFFFLSENSRFVENRIWRILVLRKTRIGEFFFCFFYQRILVLWKQRILVLWKTGTGELSFCGKPESENFFFNFLFFLFYQRILVLWKRRILVLW